MSTYKKVIVALDSDDEVSLEKLIHSLSPKECRLKVGKTLFTRLGPTIIKRLHNLGFDVFLDLKFHDIPQQVYGACLEAAALGVWMLNVHALGGNAMLQAAKAAVDKAAVNFKKKPLLIGVTLLTSLKAEDLTSLGIMGSPEEVVMRLAKLCFDAGLDGVVCSANEVRDLKKTFGKNFVCVTPGIRLPDDDSQDQQRIMTPVNAIEQGSDYLVIGRSITGACAPLDILHQINRSIA